MPREIWKKCRYTSGCRCMSCIIHRRQQERADKRYSHSGTKPTLRLPPKHALTQYYAPRPPAAIKAIETPYRGPSFPATARTFSNAEVVTEYLVGGRKPRQRRQLRHEIFARIKRWLFG